MRRFGSKPLKSLAVLSALAIWAFAAGASKAIADDTPPAFGGTYGQFTLVKPLRPAPSIPLADAEGKTVTLDRYKGKVVLLNFWATWCGPCVREMPALDALHAKLGGKSFAVVAVSVDRLGFAKITPFLKRLGIKKLHVLHDASRKLYRKAGVRGLPTTLVIDHEGRVRGYLEGPAEWDSKEAQALVRFYMAQVPARETRRRAAVKDHKIK